MIFALLTSRAASSLAGYPDWLVAAVLVVVTALGIWILGKLLQWALWLLLIAVLVAGSVAVVVLLLR